MIKVNFSGGPDSFTVLLASKWYGSLYLHNREQVGQKQKQEEMRWCASASFPWVTVVPWSGENMVLPGFLTVISVTGLAWQRLHFANCLLSQFSFFLQMSERLLPWSAGQQWGRMSQVISGRTIEMRRGREVVLSEATLLRAFVSGTEENILYEPFVL